MRDLKVPETGPKRKLLDATERLVVEKGFDLVSVRDITGAVKANVAAVNYHFGSREGLMDLVMMHVMDAVDAARVEALEVIRQQALSTDEIVSAYVNAVLTAASKVEMDLSFFLKLAGRVMVFPVALISPTLADGRKQVKGLYLQVLAGAVPHLPAADLEAAWSFFEAGLGQSLVNLSADVAPAAQAEQWIRFGVSGFGVTAPISVVKIEAPVQVVVEKQVEAPPVAAPEVIAPEPVKPRAKAPKKQDDQNMLFDL